MNFITQNPVLLPLLLLVVVPLLMHLFARTKPPVKQFSSVEFILKALKSNLRMKRPQDILLLIVRTMIFIFIISIFLRPLIFSGGVSGVFNERHVVIVIDRSASMGCLEGGQTRFAAACAEASRVLADLSSRDKANIIWLGAKPESVYPEPDINISYLQQELRKASVSSELGDVNAAVQAAVGMLRNNDVKQQVLLISDFQQTQWEDKISNVSKNIELVSVKVGEDVTANMAITRVYTEPVRPLAGEEVTYYSVLNNYSDEPLSVKVHFKSGAVRKEQTVMIPAWGTANPFVKLKPRGKGQLPYQFSLEQDSLSDDNERWGVVDIAEYLKVAVIAPSNDKTAEAWVRALDALGWASTERLKPDMSIKGRDFDVLLIAEVDSSKVDVFRKENSHAVIVWSPGEGESSAGINGLVNAGEKHSEHVLSLITSTVPVGIKLSNTTDEIFHLIRNVEDYHPDAVFFSRLDLKEDLINGKVLVSFDDGVPALIKISGESPIYIWNMPLGSKQSNMALRPSYIPFISELLLNSRTKIAGNSHLVDYNPGSSLFLDYEQNGSGAIQLVYGEDKEITLEASAIKGQRNNRRVSSDVAKCGLYTWKEQGETVAHQCVNLHIDESDLRPMNDSQIKSYSQLSGPAVVLRKMSDGFDIWPLLLWAVVALLVVEGVITIWTERT